MTSEFHTNYLVLGHLSPQGVHRFRKAPEAWHNEMQERIQKAGIKILNTGVLLGNSDWLFLLGVPHSLVPPHALITSLLQQSGVVNLNIMLHIPMSDYLKQS